MKETDDKEKRWLAYFLDELPESDRARVEAELEAAPEEARAMEGVVRDVRDWSRPAADAPATNLASIYDAAESASPPGPSGWRRARAVLPWAAAAVFAVVLSQANVSIGFGDTTLGWGAQPNAERVAVLEEQLGALEGRAAEDAEYIDAVASRLLDLERTVTLATTQLAEGQRIEAATRYRDIERLIRGAGIASGANAVQLTSALDRMSN